MRKTATFAFVTLAATALAGCGAGGILNRERPDEFAVQRQAPLVVPPDFSLTPPAPGAQSSRIAFMRAAASRAWKR